MISLRKFLGETYLHGFSYWKWKNSIFVMFWAAATTVCIGFAVHDLILLVQSYQSVPYQAGLAVEPNRNITLPTPTLCMEIFVVEPNVRQPTDADIMADIDAFMYATDNGTNNDVYTSEDMSLTDSLEFLTYLLLGYISNSEMLIMKPNDPIFDYYANAKRYQSQDGYQPLWQWLQTAYSYYMQYEIPLSNLKRLIGSSICWKQFQDAQAGKLLDENVDQLQICQPDTITHLSFSLVCSRVFVTDTYSTGDVKAISIGSTVSASNDNRPSNLIVPPIIMKQMCRHQDPNTLSFVAAKFNRTSISLHVGDDGSFPNMAKFLWHLDLQGRSVFPTDSLQDVIAIDPKVPVQRFTVAISVEFNFYDVPSVRPCVTTELQYQCKWRKMVERLSQACGCWPSSIIDLVNTNELPICNNDITITDSGFGINPFVGGSDYSADYNSRCDSDLDFSIDDSDCPKDCQYFVYSSSSVDAYRFISTQNVTNASAAIDRPDRLPGAVEEVLDGSFEVIFQTETFRTVITEELTMPFTSFACGFGGIIGTWLGGSVLAFMHVPIFILTQLYDHYQKHKRADNNNDNVKTITKEAIYPKAEAHTV